MQINYIITSEPIAVRSIIAQQINLTKKQCLDKSNDRYILAPLNLTRMADSDSAEGSVLKILSFESLLF